MNAGFVRVSHFRGNPAFLWNSFAGLAVQAIAFCFRSNIWAQLLADYDEPFIVTMEERINQRFTNLHSLVAHQVSAFRRRAC
jgi:hypothetical protein